MKRRKTTRGEEEEKEMDKDCIVWQTPANPPERHDYIFRDGRRFVRPYFFEFISHAKNRWAGKTIVDLFADEFKGRPYEYYVSAVKCGRIRVDGEVVPVSYVVKSSQKISHFLHRHEPPVFACDVSVLQLEPDVLTVCKPATVPVHPCGQYRKNTVVGILQAEHDLAPLFPVHRLDRLVSGLLILARNAVKADDFRQQKVLVNNDGSHPQYVYECILTARLLRLIITPDGEGGLVRKLYIAKVVGEFPENEVVINASINYNAREGRSTAEVPESGVKAALQKGKAACTKFTRVSTNGTHSIVECEPVTGRTHQIRVHLKHASHPIANDVLYLSDFGNNPSTEGRCAGTGVLDSCSGHKGKRASNDFDFDPMCTNCPDLSPRGYGAEEEGLWLHCVRYSGPGWTYECPYPNWASLV